MKFQIISCNIILNLSQFLIGEITNLFVYAIPYPLPGPLPYDSQTLMIITHSSGWHFDLTVEITRLGIDISAQAEDGTGLDSFRFMAAQRGRTAFIIGVCLRNRQSLREKPFAENLLCVRAGILAHQTDSAEPLPLSSVSSGSRFEYPPHRTGPFCK